MNKYIVSFMTKEDDYQKEWCWAKSKEEAKQKILGDHWNIKKIVSVSILE